MQRALALVCLLLLGLVSAAKAETREIRIGWQPAAFFEFFYAQQEKLFEKAGLKPIYVKFSSSPPMLAAMKAGDLDVAFGGMPAYIAAIAERMDVALFCWLETGNTSLIMQSNEEITSAKQLIGKKIATVNGSSAQWTLLKYLKAQNIALKDVSIVYMSLPSLMPAFANRDVDGVAVWEPWGFKLTSAGGKPFGPFVGASDYVQPAIYWGRRQWMADHPQAMNMFLEALDESLHAIRAKPEAGAKALAQYAGMDPDDALKILTSNKHVLAKDMHEVFEGSPLAFKPRADEKYSGQVKFTKEMADFLFQNGNITRELGLDEIVKATSPEYLETYIASRPPSK